MKTELLGQEKNIVKIKLEIEPEEFSEGLKTALNELSQSLNIPGFRKGRAPRRVIEMRFGRDAIYNEALEKIMPKNLEKITEDYELETIGTPAINVEAIKEGEPVICEIKFEVMPEVELPDIENLEIEKIKPEVSDEHLEDLIWRIRRRNSEKKPVDRPANSEDIINVDFTIQVPDESGTEDIGPTDNQIDLADKTVRPEVAAALAGHSAGETVETDFDIEPDHVEKRIAGKHVHYIMDIKQVYECVMPELDQELFKKYYGENTDVSTEDEFRTRLLNELQTQMERECNDDARNRAIDKIVRLAKLDVPESMVSREMEALEKNDEELARKDYNANLKEILSEDNPEWEKGYKIVLRSRASGVVRYSLVINAIAKKYDVNIEKEDVEAELDKRAALYNLDKEVLRSYFYRNQNELARLINALHENKVLDALMGLVKIKEVDKLSPEALARPENLQEPENNENNENKENENSENSENNENNN